MSANYTDEHLANITEQMKHAEQTAHLDSVNLYQMLKEHRELLKSIKYYAKWSADVARFYFFLTLLGIIVTLLLFFLRR